MEIFQEYILPDCPIENFPEEKQSSISSDEEKYKLENIIVKTEESEEHIYLNYLDIQNDNCAISKVKVEMSQPDETTKSLICKICSYTTKKTHNFKRHADKCTGMVYTCNECKFATTRESVFKKHRLNTRRCTKDFKCPSCSFETELYSNLKRHEKCCPSEKPESCAYCNIRSKTKEALKRHIKRYHNDELLSVQTMQGLGAHQNTLESEKKKQPN